MPTGNTWSTAGWKEAWEGVTFPPPDFGPGHDGSSLSPDYSQKDGSLALLLVFHLDVLSTALESFIALSSLS